MTVDLSGYVEVRDRIVMFREKHPEGSLRPVDPANPYRIETIEVDGVVRNFVVYAAAAYRSPDDPMPGIGVAWEPFPGRTRYTRDSELMNAETSAWGRAIVAALAADAGAIATAEDVRNRRAADEPRDPATWDQLEAIRALGAGAGITDEQLMRGIKRDYGRDSLDDLTAAQADEVIARLKAKAVS